MVYWEDAFNVKSLLRLCVGLRHVYTAVLTVTICMHQKQFEIGLSRTAAAQSGFLAWPEDVWLLWFTLVAKEMGETHRIIDGQSCRLQAFTCIGHVTYVILITLPSAV